MCSLETTYSEESKAEIKALLNMRQYYVNNTGKLNYSLDYDTVVFALTNMTGKPVPRVAAQ